MKKKILILNAQVDFWGASRSCLTSGIALKEAGYDVMMMATWRGPIAPIVEDCGIRFEVCAYHTWMLWPTKQSMQVARRINQAIKLIWNSIGDFRRMNMKLKQLNYKPDLIYSNTIMQPMGLMLSAYLKVPHIYHIREYGRADFGMYPILGEKFSFYFAYKYTEMAICISKGVQKEWSRCFREKAILLYNGVTVNQKEITPRTHIKGTLRIIVVGRISPEKGQRDVIKALCEIYKRKDVENITLDLYGEGVDLEKLKNMTQMLGLGNKINFCGFSYKIPYNQYDIAIMSSRSEGFGRTTIEYMLNGVPVIGYNGGATPELILDGKTGKLYNSPEELAEILLDAYKSLGKFQTYAKNAFERSVVLFSEETYKQKLVHLIRSISF